MVLRGHKPFSHVHIGLQQGFASIFTTSVTKVSVDIVVIIITNNHFCFYAFKFLAIPMHAMCDSFRGTCGRNRYIALWMIHHLRAMVTLHIFAHPRRPRGSWSGRNEVNPAKIVAAKDFKKSGKSPRETSLSRSFPNGSANAGS